MLVRIGLVLLALLFLIIIFRKGDTSRVNNKSH